MFNLRWKKMAVFLDRSEEDTSAPTGESLLDAEKNKRSRTNR